MAHSPVAVVIFTKPGHKGTFSCSCYLKNKNKKNLGTMAHSPVAVILTSLGTMIKAHSPVAVSLKTLGTMIKAHSPVAVILKSLAQ